MKPDAGATAGIVIGVLLVFAGAGVGAAYYYQYRNRGGSGSGGGDVSSGDGGSGRGTNPRPDHTRGVEPGRPRSIYAPDSYVLLEDVDE
jgi:hypothetical protein